MGPFTTIADFFAGLLRRFSEIVLGPALLRRPSERIMRAIRREEDNSEILVGWVQIAAIVFFAGFYAGSPKGFSPDVPFEPVPATLGVYALFTGIRLVLAYREALRTWFLALSVIVDIAVLMITIWSFHLQYQQPATIYLKAPTLLYVFILIALRALRFDPRWVILAGLSAATGWLTLLLYALHGESMAAVLTHSYVEYATSLKVLIGAEVDKMVSILMVTAVLALSLFRGRRLLVRSVAEEVAAAELSRFFAPEIAATILDANDAIHPGVGVQRNAATMFIDLRGFTALSSVLEPSAVVAMLGEYQAIVVPIVRRYGGGIITYLGDGIMAAFGATRDSDTCAADALAATEELIVALSMWAERRRAEGLHGPESGIGVAWGTVICGAIGTEDRLEYAVIGDPVNRAAKLQALTKTVNARALVAAPAWSAAMEQGFRPVRLYRQHSDCILAGVSDPVKVVALA
jgi:adenylate cyclase